MALVVAALGPGGVEPPIGAGCLKTRGNLRNSPALPPWLRPGGRRYIFPNVGPANGQHPVPIGTYPGKIATAQVLAGLPALPGVRRPARLRISAPNGRNEGGGIQTPFATSAEAVPAYSGMTGSYPQPRMSARAPSVCSTVSSQQGALSLRGLRAPIGTKPRRWITANAVRQGNPRRGPHRAALPASGIEPD